ncbi:hypothetical protein HK097_010985 [Rhizophlyctis rosea]|uniref:Uncharacterized protein n=1 Tax=Rhizophlyctis rosea TaxID=64517 RepID=A0AAD5X054_9FUNG|nr:hypothetical protein HK097_010985 [Rhizophlyctis rosea]
MLPPKTSKIGHLFSSLSLLSLLLSHHSFAVPLLENVSCPSRIPLGSQFRLSFTLKDDPALPARGVANIQVFAQNALGDWSRYGSNPISSSSASQLATVTSSGLIARATQTTDVDQIPPPTTGGEPVADGSGSEAIIRVQNIVDLEAGGMDLEFDWYRFGPHGIVNFTGQPVCIRSSMPYGKDIDALGNPEGYADQTICPLSCTIVKPNQQYAYFSNLTFSPQTVHVGQNLTIQWDYEDGFNFPETVLLSVFFASNYYEEYPQYIIGDVDAKPGKYTLLISSPLRDFVTRNTQPGWPFRLYLQLAFPPQTNVLGGLFSDQKANLTILPSARDWRRMKGGKSTRKTVTSTVTSFTRGGGEGVVTLRPVELAGRM